MISANQIQTRLKAHRVYILSDTLRASNDVLCQHPKPSIFVDHLKSSVAGLSWAAFGQYPANRKSIFIEGYLEHYRILNILNIFRSLESKIWSLKFGV